MWKITKKALFWLSVIFVTYFTIGGTIVFYIETRGNFVIPSLPTVATVKENILNKTCDIDSGKRHAKMLNFDPNYLMISQPRREVGKDYFSYSYNWYNGEDSGVLKYHIRDNQTCVIHVYMTPKFVHYDKIKLMIQNKSCVISNFEKIDLGDLKQLFLEYKGPASAEKSYIWYTWGNTSSEGKLYYSEDPDNSSCSIVINVDKN